MNVNCTPAAIVDMAEGPAANTRKRKLIVHELPARKARVTTSATLQTESKAASTAAHEPHSKPHASQTDSKRFLQVVEESGDLFAAPSASIIVHACNCEGRWGKGIAKAFHDSYPSAYEVYRKHRLASDRNTLVGTALIIPPCEKTAPGSKKSSKPNHFIGCLFTSRSSGRTRDSRAKILQQTDSAMRDMLARVKALEGASVERIWMCRINSGLFGVPWKETKHIMERIEVEEGMLDSVTVVVPG